MSNRQRVWQATGRVVSWLLWPGIWFILHGSMRTRVIIVYRQQVLVTRTWLSDGKWQLPGGGLRKGESSSDGVLRELYEETGVHLKPELLRRHSQSVHSSIGARYNYVLFVARVSKKLALKPHPPEISAVDWIDWRSLSPKNANEDLLKSLEAWHRK